MAPNPCETDWWATSFRVEGQGVPKPLSQTSVCLRKLNHTDMVLVILFLIGLAGTYLLRIILPENETEEPLE